MGKVHNFQEVRNLFICYCYCCFAFAFIAILLHLAIMTGYNGLLGDRELK